MLFHGNGRLRPTRIAVIGKYWIVPVGTLIDVGLKHLLIVLLTLEKAAVKVLLIIRVLQWVIQSEQTTVVVVVGVVVSKREPRSRRR